MAGPRRKEDLDHIINPAEEALYMAVPQAAMPIHKACLDENAELFYMDALGKVVDSEGYTFSPALVSDGASIKELENA